LQEAIKEEKKVEEVKPKKASCAGKRTMKHKNNPKKEQIVDNVHYNWNH
jgi:hypothetical protein